MYDLIIIGGGPCGASAATFTARAGLRTVVIDADKGITRRAMVYNHLGFPDGITGPELVERGRAQAERSGAEWVAGNATALEATEGGYVVRTDDATFEGVAVLLATGVSASLAEAAGLEVTTGVEPRIPKRIVVDDQGRTALAGVWAAGTAAGASVHTIVTAGDGARVALNLLSERVGERHVDHDVLPSTD